MIRFVLFCAALLFAALAISSTQAVARASMSHDREIWNTCPCRKFNRAGC
jgi:Mn2+/Fe2+ NRAMP family transporter